MTIAFMGARLIDGNGGAPLESATVIVGDDLRFGHYAPAIAGVRYVFGLGADRF